MELVRRHVQLQTHFRAELLREVGVRDVAVAAFIEEVPHQGRNLRLGGVDFVLQKSRFEVLVRHVAITVLIVASENLEELGFSCKRLVFDLG